MKPILSGHGSFGVGHGEVSNLSDTTVPGLRPDFEAPPVVEVRLTVNFERVPRIRGPHFGLLWGALGGPGTLAEAEDLYPEPTDLETFPAPSGTPPFDFKLFEHPRPTRAAFRSGDGHSVEVQDDALSVSWSAGSNVGYPRYEVVRAKFEAAYGHWSSVLQRVNAGVPRVKQAEVTYVNHLPIGVGWADPTELSNVVRFAQLPVDQGIEGVEDVHLYQRHVLRRAGEPWGRLYISFDSARQNRESDKKVANLSLTVRGIPAGDTSLDALRLLDDGHAIIVASFAACTTPEMHTQWGRNDT